MKKAPWTRAFPRQAAAKAKALRRGFRRLRSVSTHMSKRKAEYRQVRKSYLSQHRFCVCCLKRGQQPVPSTQVHHKKGRGRYLLDQATWAAVCAPCHEYIHNHPAWGYSTGMLWIRANKR